MPAISAAAAVAQSGASASKALWASLYANAGSAAEFTAAARHMGLSNAAIQGVSARTIGVRMAVTATTKTLSGTGTKTLNSHLTSSGNKLDVRRNLEHLLEQYMPDEADNRQAKASPDIGDRSEQSLGDGADDTI